MDDQFQYGNRRIIGAAAHTTPWSKSGIVGRSDQLNTAFSKVVSRVEDGGTQTAAQIPEIGGKRGVTIERKALITSAPEDGRG